MELNVFTLINLPIILIFFLVLILAIAFKITFPIIRSKRKKETIHNPNVTPARRRLIKDFKKLQEDPPAGVSGTPSRNNIMLWNAIIFGPSDTPFEDGTFKLSIKFTEAYPNRTPIARFVSTIFHPNVYVDGTVCLDILRILWSPTHGVSAFLTSIQSLLSNPDVNFRANQLAAQLYEENRQEYEKRVKVCVEQSWMD